ncbi:MAG TPA: metalloregulator ArsR/SmtB family transcription factor [Dehalococcoidia bacterium]|nr:metalloregulator ArsR/SmtB family transcription factor [Dehalococcoidia bacterium]
MNRRTPAILDHLSVLSDVTRSRLLLLLDRHELTVSELRAILQLPQSTVSRHLKALAEDGWISARSEGTSHLYTGMRDGVDSPSERLWALVREQLVATTPISQDERRLQMALSERRTKSQAFFASAATQWDRLRKDLFGDRFDVASLAGLADPSWLVGDLGCGTGQVSAALAPFVASVIAVDESGPMLQAAEQRLAEFDNVELRKGELEALPVEDRSIDLATLILVLHYIPEPQKALVEASRALRPGGRLLVVDMLPHDREAYRQQMGHVWLGFDEDLLQRMLGEAGFAHARIVAMPHNTKAKGPALFVARAEKAGEGP